MPSNWLYIDTNFPTFTGEENTEEKVTTIQNYMFMLVEQLRYSLRNLDLSNMNKTAVERYETTLTEPIYARIENEEGNVAQLALTAAALGLRLNDVEGNVTSLTATAEGLSLQISDAEDDIIQLGITADGLATSVGNVEGKVSSLSQTVDSITLSVSNGTDSSVIKLMRDGVAVSSKTIQFTGMVSFADLKGNGTTVINGSNISTGTISAINISGCTIEGSTFRSTLSYSGVVGGEIEFYYLNTNYLAGGIRLDDQGAGTSTENTYRMFLYTNNVLGVAFALKLKAAGGISIESDKTIFIEAATQLILTADTVNINGALSINGVPYQ
ncbi:hypothetical protein [uncultured Flavonifractor sp.]|uniref:hypothetical protein n=1 Tax=uncultured Flavonifractor sp. TaxID=1193534 RepID=UPI0026159CD2|nr:hypothetical protein [uncultured Flavonifractor sp.]